MTLAQFDFLRLALFSGKGGVGKTTLSCGFARRWAREFPLQRILLLSTDPAHSLGDALQRSVDDQPRPLEDLPNLQVRALDAETLLEQFKSKYGVVLEALVERGSFVQGEDLQPVWDLSWPGINELMGILEIQRLLHQGEADRIVVDMAPSGHTLTLFKLMDFLDGFLEALELFQAKHRAIQQAFTHRYTADEADQFLQAMKQDLARGRQLMQDPSCTACLVVAIPEAMSWLETQRFLASLEQLKIPVGGILVNRVLLPEPGSALAPEPIPDRLYEQQSLLEKFHSLAPSSPLLVIPQQTQDPVGMLALDSLIEQVQPAPTETSLGVAPVIHWPVKILPSLPDFIEQGRRLILVGGKGGVGKTTVAAAIAWGMAQKYPDRPIRAISIDPAHSLGDVLGQALGHASQSLAARPNLTAQEVDAAQIMEQFRKDYLWELADMMSGDQAAGDSNLQLAYGPEAWRKIVAQALPGIDEMLALITVMDLLERQEQDLIVLDTAPTGHLLSFLAMPTALGDWLAWIFKLWIKYQAVLGRTDLMGRLRTLRQRVMAAQKRLKDPRHTEFIGVFQSQSGIVAETARLGEAMAAIGIAQHFLVHNRYEPGQPRYEEQFQPQTIVHLPQLPRSVPPLERINGAATLLF